MDKNQLVELEELLQNSDGIISTILEHILDADTLYGLDIKTEELQQIGIEDLQITLYKEHP